MPSAVHQRSEQREASAWPPPLADAAPVDFRPFCAPPGTATRFVVARGGCLGARASALTLLGHKMFKKTDPLMRDKVKC